MLIIASTKAATPNLLKIGSKFVDNTDKIVKILLKAKKFKKLAKFKKLDFAKTNFLKTNFLISKAKKTFIYL